MPDAKNDKLEADGRLKRKEYEHGLARLHVEFVKLQQWVVREGLKVCIVFEGRDGAGNGGTIKAMTERVSHGRRPPRADRAQKISNVPSGLTQSKDSIAAGFVR